MSEIEVQLDWRDVDIPGLQRQLSKRFFGRWGWPGVGIAAAVAGTLVYPVLEARSGGGAGGVFAVAVGLAVFALLGLRMQRKLTQAIYAAPVRQEPSRLIIGPEGLTGPGAMIAGRLPWRWVTDMVEIDSGLLILFSPVEYIPVLDAWLPAGADRAALRAQIETWREAAS